MPKRKKPPTASRTRATRPRPMPRISTVEPPDFFFLGSSSSSSSRRRGPGLGLPGAALPLVGFLVVTLAGAPGLAFLAGLSSSSSPPLGSSTTKRYLHLGQSIFLPISWGLRIGTIASQLGHSCLNPVPVAMLVYSASGARPWGALRELNDETLSRSLYPRPRPVCKDQMPYSDDFPCYYNTPRASTLALFLPPFSAPQPAFADLAVQHGQ